MTKDPSKGKDIICEYQEDDVVRGRMLLVIVCSICVSIAIIIGNENEYVLLSFHSEETTDLKLVSHSFITAVFYHFTGLR